MTNSRTMMLKVTCTRKACVRSFPSKHQGTLSSLGVQFLYTAVFKIKLFYFMYLYFSWPTQGLVCAYMYVEMSHVQNVNTS